MDRQEGYYWVKYKRRHIIAEYYTKNNSKYWLLTYNEKLYQDSDFEHINEVRIKFPGELPD
jgi:hypothetical protein